LRALARRALDFRPTVQLPSEFKTLKFEQSLRTFAESILDPPILCFCCRFSHKYPALPETAKAKRKSTGYSITMVHAAAGTIRSLGGMRPPSAFYIIANIFYRGEYRKEILGVSLVFQAGQRLDD
jgi:hypothetical protein